MNGSIIKIFCFFLLPVLFYSCSETKTLEPGQYLYDGAKIKIKSRPEISRRKANELKSEMNNLLRPKPNGSFLGIKVKLLLYNLPGKPKAKGLGHFIQDKLGEPPVLASYSAMEKNRAVLQNRLENRGYFKDTVILDTMYKGRKMSAVYTAEIGYQYTIRNVVYPSDPDSLDVAIARLAPHSLLKKGDPYNLDIIKAERVRIDTRLKQRGYYYFSPDDLLIRADSMIGDHQVNLTLIVKKSTPSEAREVFHIKDVIVFANYNVHADTSINVSDVPRYHGYIIIDSGNLFKPKIFATALVFKPGDVYNRRDHDLSLSRLISLGVFKFVKIRFDEKDTSEKKLNAYYYLTPTEKKSIRFEVSGLTQSDNANGGQVSVNWRNRNIFRGAELLTTTAYVGYLKTKSWSGFLYQYH